MLVQVLLTEDSEKARAAALAALEEGEMLVEPLPLPAPQGMPHLAPMPSVGSSAFPSITSPQPATLMPASFPALQTQGEGCSPCTACTERPLSLGRFRFAMLSTHDWRFMPLMPPVCRVLSSRVAAAHVSASGICKLWKIAERVRPPPSPSCRRSP